MLCICNHDIYVVATTRAIENSSQYTSTWAPSGVRLNAYLGVSSFVFATKFLYQGRVAPRVIVECLFVRCTW